MIQVVDAGVLAYQPAWDMQLALHEKVLAGEFGDGALMLVEHPPVITIGRRAGAQGHLLASEKMLALRGVEVSETDRGGDITFHGPGQMVAYPILPLNRYGMNLHGYMRFLEQAVINTLAAFNITAIRDDSPDPATGVWVRTANEMAKICALGIKVRRWVTLHGIALNVTTDLTFFDLINPCGLSRPVTSMKKLLGDRVPEMTRIKEEFARGVTRELGQILAK